jgi:multisubunit Na+/H+ antiporter MnhC subunit
VDKAGGRRIAVVFYLVTKRHCGVGEKTRCELVFASLIFAKHKKPVLLALVFCSIIVRFCLMAMVYVSVGSL